MTIKAYHVDSLNKVSRYLNNFLLHMLYRAQAILNKCKNSKSMINPYDTDINTFVYDLILDTLVYNSRAKLHMYKNAISYIMHKVFIANNPLSEKRSDGYLIARFRKSLDGEVKFYPPCIYYYDIVNTVNLLYEYDPYLDIHIEYSTHLSPENITRLSGIYEYNRINPNLMKALINFAEYITTLILSNSNRLTLKVINTWFDKSNKKIIELTEFIKKSQIWNNSDKLLMVIGDGVKRKLKDIHAREIFYIYKVVRQLIDSPYYEIDTLYILKSKHTNLKYKSGKYKVYDDIPSIEEFVSRNSKLVQLIESTVSNIFNEYRKRNVIIDKLIDDFTIRIMPAVFVYDKKDTRIWLRIYMSLADIFYQLCKSHLHSDLKIDNHISLTLNFAIKL